MMIFNSAFGLLELPSLANGIPTINSNGIHSQPKLIPNGMPSTVVPCGTERITSNGHVTALSESPFIGYIIAIHRKMVKKMCCLIAPYYSYLHIIVPVSPNSIKTSFFLTDADRIIFPVIAEESTQPFWNATNSALYCPHQKEGPVRCSVDSGLSPRQPTAPTGGQQPCPGLVSMFAGSGHYAGIPVWLTR